VPRYVYREINGTWKPVEVSERRLLKGTPPEATMGFHENVLKAYQHLEETAQWQGAYASPSEVKRIHEQALERAKGER
jgi:hypothetical protein